MPDGTEPEDEVIGRREHPRIIAAYGGVYEDRQAEIMLAQHRRPAAAAADQPNAQFTVTILDSSEVNAFALPGRLRLRDARHPRARLRHQRARGGAGARDRARHAASHARARTNRMRTSAIVDRVVTGVFGGDVATDQTANQSRVSLAAFSQQQELEADKEGIEIAGKAGFDPACRGAVPRRDGPVRAVLGGRRRRRPTISSRRHPSTPDRIQKAAEAARALLRRAGDRRRPTRAGYHGGDRRHAVRRQPAEGAIVGRRFIHPALKFTFTVPQGYTLQNSKNAVVGVAGDGEAVRFDSAEVPATMPLDQYLKSGWIAGLDAETRCSGMSSNGIEMATGIAVDRPVELPRLGGALRGRGLPLHLRGQGRQRRASARAPPRRSRASARRRRADLAQIRKVSLKVVTAKAGDTADCLARQMQNLTRGTGLFYILNNLFPGDPVVAGEKYKVVVLN